MKFYLLNYGTCIRDKCKVRARPVHDVSKHYKHKVRMIKRFTKTI